MKYTILPGTDLNISRVALGTLFIGGVDETEAVSAIHYSLDQGVNMIDTAEGYGRGNTEEMIGRAIAGRRDKVIIATKGGLDWGQHADKAPRSTEQHISMAGKRVDSFRNSNPAWITASIDSSLRRLKTDYIDLYQIHYPNTTTPWEDTIAALEKAKAAGKIRYYGLSNFSVQQMQEWLKHGPIYSMQPPYNMLDRGIEEEILPFCRKSGIGILTYGSLGHGLLSGKFNIETHPQDSRKELKVFKGDAYAKNIAIVDKLKGFALSKEITIAQLAIAWVLAQPGITSALVGAKRPDQVKDNVKAAECFLSTEDLEHISTILNFKSS